MMDQLHVLKEFAFPTVMILPQGEIATSSGRTQGTRIFAESFGKPIVLYLKHENAMSVADVQRLVDEGIVCAIKYAVVHQDPAKDEYLKHLIDVVDPNIIVSGIGEQPAIVHLRQFHLNGFTSGCVCVQPALSQEMLHAIKASNWERAEQIRNIFQPLEDLRNSIHPIRVLHAAVRLAGIADTGPILPLLSPTTLAEDERIEAAATVLRSQK
jgi:dihydrodipicolinate synthase/N-acetylneuraminate lyase